MATVNPYAAPYSDLNAVRQIAETHGFCLIKNVFPADDMAEIYDASAATHDRFPDLLSCPDLAWFVFEPRILEIARHLMGDALAYYGETGFNFERTIGKVTTDAYNDLHIDSVGMPQRLDKVWRGAPGQIFRGYRFALYFQDYEKFSGGLKVAPGSHLLSPEFLNDRTQLRPKETLALDGQGSMLSFRRHVQELYNLPSEPGDLVIWNLRTMHAGRAQRLAINPALSLPPAIEDMIARQAPHALLPQPGPRNAIFLDLAQPVEEVDLYIKARTQIKLDLDSGVDAWTYDAAETIAAANGIRMRYDKLILALAMKLRAKGDPDGALMSRLLRLGKRHEEYSPHFPLFPKNAFMDLANKAPREAGERLAKWACAAANLVRAPAHTEAVN